MQGEEGDLMLHGQTRFGPLDRGGIPRDGDVAEIVALAGLDRERFVALCGEREHIGRGVVIEVVAMERLDAFIISDEQCHCRRRCTLGP